MPEIERELAEIRNRLELILNPPAVAPTTVAEPSPLSGADADAGGGACNDANVASSDVEAVLAAAPTMAADMAAATATPDGGDAAVVDGRDSVNGVDAAPVADDNEETEEVDVAEDAADEAAAATEDVVPMEEVVLTAFLLALHTTVKTADLPMLVSTFYPNHVLPVCWFVSGL